MSLSLHLYYSSVTFFNVSLFLTHLLNLLEVYIGQFQQTDRQSSWETLGAGVVRERRKNFTMSLNPLPSHSLPGGRLERICRSKGFFARDTTGSVRKLPYRITGVKYGRACQAQVNML
jgi:hypothetical protein